MFCGVCVCVCVCVRPCVCVRVCESVSWPNQYPNGSDPLKPTAATTKTVFKNLQIKWSNGDWTVIEWAVPGNACKGLHFHNLFLPSNSNAVPPYWKLWLDQSPGGRAMVLPWRPRTECRFGETKQENDQQQKVTACRPLSRPLLYPQSRGRLNGRHWMMMMMSWCLMSSDVIWHIRDKLWPMPKHGSIKATYVRCMRV